MCLVLFAHQPGAANPLIVAANRDEFHARPTATAAFWQDHPQVFAGRDLQAGGTWMGVSRSGRFAAITNYRDPDQTREAPRSRGELTTDFLTGTLSAHAYLNHVAEKSSDYAGFNLVIKEGDTLWYLSNGADAPRPRQLLPGVYGLSNARLDTPWPKVERGKQALLAMTEKPPSHTELATVVSGRTMANADQLEALGLNGDMDPMLSAQFIVNEQYGTRAMTTLWQQSDGRFDWQEISYSPSGEPAASVRQTIG